MRRKGKLTKLNVRNLNKLLKQKKTQYKNFKKENKEKQFQLVQLMKNKKELEKILYECVAENSRLKKKRSYWCTKCRKLKMLLKMLPCSQE